MMVTFRPSSHVRAWAIAALPSEITNLRLACRRCVCGAPIPAIRMRSALQPDGVAILSPGSAPLVGRRGDERQGRARRSAAGWRPATGRGPRSPFAANPRPCPVVVGRADGHVGGIAVRSSGGRSDRAAARPRRPCLIPRAGCPAAGSSSLLSYPAPFSAPRAHDLGRPQSRKTIAARLISPPA